MTAPQAPHAEHGAPRRLPDLAREAARPGRQVAPLARRAVVAGGAPAAPPVAVVAAVPRHRLDDAARPGRRPGPGVLPLPADRQRARRRPRHPGQAGRAAGLAVRADPVRRHRQHRHDQHDPARHRHRLPARVPRGGPVARHHPGAQRATPARRPRSPRSCPATSACRASPPSCARRSPPTPRTRRRRSSRSRSEQTGQAVPAVIVGSQVDGADGRALRALLRLPDGPRGGHPRGRLPHLHRRRHRPGPAGGRRRLRRHPAGRRPRTTRRARRRAAVLRPAQRADDAPAARTTSPGWPAAFNGMADNLQTPDPPAGGPLARPAALRLRRLARAAHAADDDPDGRRAAARLARRLRPRRWRGRPSCCTRSSTGSRRC